MPDNEVASRLNAQYLVYGKLIGGRSESRVMISLRNPQGDEIWQREYQISSSSIQQMEILRRLTSLIHV
jgi:hypothetical protein